MNHIQHGQGKSGNSFIDDNHDGLLQCFDNFTLFLKGGYETDAFYEKGTNFLDKLESHFKHEEIIIDGAAYTDTETHKTQHRELALKLRMMLISVDSEKAALDYILKARSDLLNHELLEDQAYWPVFESQGNKVKEPFILWTEDLCTGVEIVDRHHKALINHLNRLHERLEDNGSDVKLSSELRSLHAYTQLHFVEEERELGKHLKPSHFNEHKELLASLNHIITEVEKGAYQIASLGDYLKYWLINHLRKHDIPAFSK